MHAHLDNNNRNTVLRLTQLSAATHLTLRLGKRAPPISKQTWTASTTHRLSEKC